MNLKRIIIAITVVLIGTGNINAQDMKTEVPKISDFPVGEENTGYRSEEHTLNSSHNA